MLGARERPRAEARPHLDLARVTRGELDRAARGDGRRHRAQTDRAAAHDRHALAAAHARAPEPVEGDRERLHQAGVARAETRRERDQTALGHHDLARHAAVAADAVDHLHTRATYLIIAAPAELAGAARRDRLDRHGRPVGELSGDLVAGDAGHREARVEHREVRAADAAGADAHAHAGARAARRSPPRAPRRSRSEPHAPPLLALAGLRRVGQPLAAMPSASGWDIYAIHRRPDLHAALAELRARAAVHALPGGVFLVTRFAEAERALRAPELEAGSGVAASFAGGSGRLASVMASWLMSLDGAPHDRARGLVRREFTPRRVEALRAPIAATVKRLVAALVERARSERVDLVAGPRASRCLRK